VLSTLQWKSNQAQNIATKESAAWKPLHDLGVDINTGIRYNICSIIFSEILLRNMK